MAIKDKPTIRVWDIPRIVFEESHRLTAKDSKKEVALYPGNFGGFHPEIRIFQGLDERKTRFDGLICLQIFPESKTEKMQSIFYLWIGKTLADYDYNDVGEFSNFAKQASLCINGWRQKGKKEDIDMIAVYPMKFSGWAMASVQFRFIYEIMGIAKRVCELPGFMKERVSSKRLTSKH